jgi:hypothetical protein
MNSGFMENKERNFKSELLYMAFSIKCVILMEQSTKAQITKLNL